MMLLLSIININYMVNLHVERVTFLFESITLLFERYRIAFRTHFQLLFEPILLRFLCFVTLRNEIFERGFCYRWRAILWDTCDFTSYSTRFVSFRFVDYQLFRFVSSNTISLKRQLEALRFHSC